MEASPLPYILMENLRDYNYPLCVADLHTEIYEGCGSGGSGDALFKPDKTHYWIIDSPGDFALAHWIYETFIFIPILIGLNEQNRGIKIMTKNPKKYVKSMLRFFGIKNEVVHQIDNYNNYCYFPKVYSMNTSQNIETDEYYNLYLNLYIAYIQRNTPIIQSIKAVFLPRNTIDNYSQNDRVISNTEKIKEIVIEKGGMVLDTYALNNIKYQFSIINNAEIVILDYGSSLFLNCIFLKNKKIYIIDNHNQASSHHRFSINNYLYNKIASNNEVRIITSGDLSVIEAIAA
jgi:capsular polysaccharide biosynthesis protein